MGDVTDRQVFRSAGSVVLWWAWLVFAAASLVALAVTGRGHSSAVTAAALIAVTGLAYGCALRPRIVADETGISVLNPVRDHVVPWAAVTKVDLVNAVRVHCAAAPGAPRGQVIYSWAVQSSGRAMLKSESRARRAARRTAHRPAGYGRLPPEARQVLEQSAAELIAQQLDERATRSRANATSGACSGQPTTGQPTTGQPTTGWAWPPIAAMALPVLALIIVALA